jgi:hypothetical protein
MTLTSVAPGPLQLAEHGRASLDGTWEFFPGDHAREDLDRLTPAAIEVPGLWEAQGYLELDGVAWYRKRFVIEDADGWWTLRFAAVMDFADVWLNGVHLGSHEHPFTPFELAVTAALRAGENLLEVRVFDPPVDHPEHIRSAHGKQGWANHVFPSRPSLYMTYGGIWQSVTLRRHGAAVTRDVFINGDPDDLVITMDIVNVSDQPVVAEVGVRTVGTVHVSTVELDALARQSVTFTLGRTPAKRWHPDAPILHNALIDVQVEGQLTDRRRLRFGLRTVRVEGEQLLVNEVPYRMKSVLVQGFVADRLYAEGTRDEIVREVLAAKAMGFTMLRLHIKAFDPVYLTVCDELGMLLECDLPIAEPIAHDELGAGSTVHRRCVEAITEQVVRDRNHPSIVLWSAMNELGLEGEGSRQSDAYESFARELYAAVLAADPTRPVIENEWVEPDPDRVFCSPILTAHWYGRLHADYLDKLERQCSQWSGLGRPLWVTEFGDWGLPAMPELENAPFWDTHEVYAAGLAATLWPASISRFVHETQRYQGLSDRLQIEVFRRHDHIGGYCLTELTDVPHELNGLLDLRREPKPAAIAEVTRANQTVLPMLKLDSMVVQTGAMVTAPLFISNDGQALDDVLVEARFGDAVALEGHATDSVTEVKVGSLDGYKAVPAGTLLLRAPQVTGAHDLLLTLRSGGEIVAENRYPVHVVEPSPAPYQVLAVGGGEDVLAAVGAEVRDEGVVVVAEGGLDADARELCRQRLAAGGTVVVLAQHPDAAGDFPVPVTLAAVATEWGSSVFHFTSDSGALPSLPRRNLLVAEESTIQADSVVTAIDGDFFPTEPVVIAYKPVPGGITGSVVGRQTVGPGTLILCQYRLADGVRRGDAAARALLADVVRWAAAPRPPTVRKDARTTDGRAISFYSYDDEGGRR